MVIRHLEILEAVQETGSFTAAAKKLFITQSAVSHAVAELERQAGTALFVRLPRGVTLTRCGISLLEESRSILTASRNLDRRISHLEENTPIKIVSSITIASFLLPKILHTFRVSFPQIRTFVQVASAQGAMDILQRGHADLAFWEGAAPAGDYQIIPLGSYRLCAACGPDFPVPGQSLTPGSLCGCPLLLREPGSSIRDTLDHALALAGQKAEPVWESVNSPALMEAAKAGLGITVLPEILLRDSFRLKKLRLVPIDNLDMENQMLALFHKDQYITSPLKLLIDQLKTAGNTCKGL